MPIRSPDRSREADFQQCIDAKTKPVGALGQLETLARQLMLIQQTDAPLLTNPHLLVFAADHGLTAEGISAYPADVTRQMVLNFGRGGAAINAFCRQNGLQLVVCDVGVIGHFDDAPGLVKLKIRPGTANSRHQPAMTADDCDAAMDAGRTLVSAVAQRGGNVVGFGEMGIGNSSAAALLMHRFTSHPLTDCVGRGTGLDDAGLRHKLAVLTDVAARNARLTDPLAILAALGGLEIAAIAGGMLEAAERGMVVLVDGFIATSALLAAHALDANVLNYCVFCHESDEAGHRLMLAWLGGRPLLRLGLRLGEGTGCALAWPLIQSAVAMLGMSTMMELMSD
jgi:nicotinate-nucleotide--dimethylbenzimidazole phosphoribosyltransferase